MIVGLHDMFDALAQYKNGVLSSDGGLSLMLLDGLLLIPVVMAAFFYPVVALEGALAVLALTAVGLVLLRVWHHGHHGHANLGSRPPRG